MVQICPGAVLPNGPMQPFQVSLPAPGPFDHTTAGIIKHINRWGTRVREVFYIYKWRFADWLTGSANKGGITRWTCYSKRPPQAKNGKNCENSVENGTAPVPLKECATEVRWLYVHASGGTSQH